MGNGTDKSLESWIWDAACSIRGAKDAGKYKDYILTLIFSKRLYDVFDDEVNRIAEEVGGRAKAFKLVKHDKKLVRFYLPLEPKTPDDSVWSVIRTLSDKIGEHLTTHLRAVADANPLLKGIIDRVDFNATTHGTRDLEDDRLSALIEAISAKRLGLKDVEPDIIGRSYEYLIRKFAEGAGKSGGELYTPAEVGFVMAQIMEPEPGLECYDPTCGSAGLLIKLDLVLRERMRAPSPSRERVRVRGPRFAPLKLYGQEYEPSSWAMAKAQIAELFQTTPQNVTVHLKAIYAEGELGETATCKDYLQFRLEGGRQVSRNLRHYRLEAILAVAFRVRSCQGTQFRQCTTARLENEKREIARRCQQQILCGT